MLFDGDEGLQGILRQVDALVALLLKEALDEGAELAVVVDDQDVQSCQSPEKALQRLVKLSRRIKVKAAFDSASVSYL